MATVTDIWGNTALTHTAQHLAGRVRDSLVAGGADSKNLIEAGDFRIDMDSRTATVRGQDLHLSCAEFDVLLFIVSHRRRIVSFNTKLATKPEECGVREAHFLPALLSLRKKLQELVPGAQYIQTEAWVLYDFHAGT